MTNIDIVTKILSEVITLERAFKEKNDYLSIDFYDFKIKMMDILLILNEREKNTE